MEATRHHQLAVASGDGDSGGVSDRFRSTRYVPSRLLAVASAASFCQRADATTIARSFVWGLRTRWSMCVYVCLYVCVGRYMTG